MGRPTSGLTFNSFPVAARKLAGGRLLQPNDLVFQFFPSCSRGLRPSRADRLRPDLSILSQLQPVIVDVDGYVNPRRPFNSFPVAALGAPRA